MVGSLSVALSLATAPAQSQDCAIFLKRALAPASYVRSVDEYRNGLPVASAQGPDELQGFIERLERSPLDARMHKCVQAAALLHTEIAMEAAREMKWRSSSHFELAQRLSVLVNRRFYRDWLLVAALFQQQVIFTRAPEAGFRKSTIYFDEALEEFPHDSEILLAAGALWEWSGSIPPGDTDRLERAERLYERSLRADPDEAEANLRYGKVLAKREKFEEAEDVLRGIFTLRADDHIIYRAHMALGSLAERKGRLDEAIRRYRGAIELLPSWQVGYIALSHGLHARGEREVSREVLDEALRFPSDDENAVGWWSYEVGLSPRLEPLLERMRSEVSR